MNPLPLSTSNAAMGVRRTNDGQLTQRLGDVATITYSTPPVEALQDDDDSDSLILQTAGSPDQWIRCETPIDLTEAI